MPRVVRRSFIFRITGFHLYSILKNRQPIPRPKCCRCCSELGTADAAALRSCRCREAASCWCRGVAKSGTAVCGKAVLRCCGTSVLLWSIVGLWRLAGIRSASRADSVQASPAASGPAINGHQSRQLRRRQRFSGRKFRRPSVSGGSASKLGGLSLIAELLNQAVEAPGQSPPPSKTRGQDPANRNTIGRQGY